ncbi:hypothetical protein EUX98_g4848 [Antrodiella citrinella]|uniref:Uncharacterized protein n=1 Tax=Antrodiella citrinella TaxID=2447956 RepID=A0A4S4MSZ7_9APHY|nr:hypothetical protein EUX98_g4848 [Antrodiella citrinella]
MVVSEVDYGMEEDRANTYSQLAIQPASSALALAVTDIASMVFNHIKSSLSTLTVYTVLIITMNTRLDATCEHYKPFPVSAASQKVLDCLIQPIKIVLTEYHGEDEDTWGHVEKNGPFSDDCDQRCIFVRRGLVVALASFEDSTSELQLKMLKFLLAVVLFHETSHFLTRHIFGSEFTPKGIGSYDHKRSCWEAGYKVERELIGKYIRAVWPHGRKWGFISLKRIEIRCDADVYIIPSTFLDKFLTSLADPDSRLPLFTDELSTPMQAEQVLIPYPDNFPRCRLTCDSEEEWEKEKKEKDVETAIEL